MPERPPKDGIFRRVLESTPEWARKPLPPVICLQCRLLAKLNIMTLGGEKVKDPEQFLLSRQ